MNPLTIRPRRSLAFLLTAVFLGTNGPQVSVAQTTAPAAPAPSQPVPTEIQAGPRALSKAFRMAARKAGPSVVTILTYGQKPAAGSRGSNPNGTPKSDNQKSDRSSNSPKVDESKQLSGLGSGVIVTDDGMVITNNHVIAGAKRVVVQLADETEIEATDVYGDPDSDVASLRISTDQLSEEFKDVELIGAGLADSDQLEIGDWVLAIGSPFQLDATVSAGIISAKNRSLKKITRGRLIQTDAAINPGNSGGPLIDLDGNVVAINTAIFTRTGGYQGIGFAIPINSAKWIADELATHGKVRRAAIGITMAELKPKIARKFRLPAGMGILAYQIIENSAAERSGIKPLDVITHFAGERVTKPESLQRIVERKPIGSMQSITVVRKGETIELEIEIASIEDPTLTQADQPEAAQPKAAQPKAAQPEATAEETESPNVAESDEN